MTDATNLPTANTPVAQEQGASLRDRATHERSRLRVSALRVGIPSAALLLAACGGDGELQWFEQPSDPEVYALAFDRCLATAKGPARTVYNDWDEAIVACQRAAQDLSRYCPTGAKCPPSANTRSDVRKLLAQGIEADRPRREAGSVRKDESPAPEGVRPEHGLINNQNNQGASS